MKDFKINFIHLCDDTIFSQDGKISLIGIFDVINLVALPGSLAKAVLVLNMSVLNKKIGKIDLDIGIKDLSINKEITKLPTVAASVPTGEEESRMGLTIQLVNLNFQNTGKYSIEVKINKELAGVLNFDVKLLEQKKGEKN